MTTLRERIWRIARGEPDPLVSIGTVAVAPPAEFPIELTDPSAAEFVRTEEATLRSSREALEAGWKPPYEHDRLVAAILADTLAFLARYGDTRPARRVDAP